jgi:nicotinamide-nucleotide amidase
MRGEIITIGNELISGRVVDINAWYAAGKLTASGLAVTRVTTVGDDFEPVSKALKEALEHSDFVIVTGGLGSTEDDMTNKIVATTLNRPLHLDGEMLDLIKNYVKGVGMEMSPSYEKMAWMPRDARLIHPKGNVCGFSLVENKVRLYFLPGVPEQMRYLMDHFVIPEILLCSGTRPVLTHRVLKVYGLGEPGIADTLKDLPRKAKNVILGFYPNFPENHITLSLRGEDEPRVMGEVDALEKEIRALLGPNVFASGDQTMEAVVGEVLRKRRLTISVAESCTGGLVANLLTNVPGSSIYFQGGVTAYSNQVKIDLLGVSPETILKHGAVSDQAVREMAEGVRKKLRTDIGVATSGIAGPDGGNEEKPVGTVHIGLATGEKTFSGKYLFRGNREQNKLNTAMMALDWVRRYLNGDPFLSRF